MPATTSNLRRIQILVGLLLTLGVPNLPLGTWGERLKIFGHLISHELLWWLAVVIVFFYAVRIERLPLSSIGLRRPGLWDLVLAILTGVLMVVGIVVIYSVVFPRFHLQMNTREMNSLMSTPFWYRFLLVTRAAVAEEALFRGYPLERLIELSGSRWIAALLSWAAFTIAHLSSWGWPQLIVAGFGGVLLTALYLWRRNLYANMLAHWIADGAGFLLPH
ncbi:MAG TPA: CPBP family intramembrane glutamic endopeptidase [Candidatus Acidoferrum sp.]